MVTFKRFEFADEKEITAQKADNIDNFLWVAFAQNSSNNCVIKKSGFSFPTQVYYSLNRQVNQVNALDLDDTNIYVAYDDSTYLGEIISKINPLTVFTTISKVGIFESPVDVAINGTDLWYLLPGSASGTNAKLLKYDTDGVFQQTVDLITSGVETVTEATSMAIDTNNDIWITTFTDPARVVRVFELSGGIYDFEITEINNP